MSDPLSVSAGVAGLVSLGIQVTQSLVAFYISYKGQDSDIARTTQTLEGLLEIFVILEQTLRTRKFQHNERNLIKRIESSVSQCDELIQELQEECQKFAKASPQGVKAVIKVAGRRAIYPFRTSTLQKLDEDITEVRDNLSLALEVLHLKDNQQAHDDIHEIKILLDLVRAAQTSSAIRDWLQAPDATVDHNAACANKHPGTGVWLIQNPAFQSWLTTSNSFLWLNGFAGCGKSVLCSTAIQYVFRHRQSNPRIGISFFYFTFNDESKQDESAMLRTLILQLSGQLRDGEARLDQWRANYKTGIPPATVLIEYLRQLIQRFQDVYVLLDALDECPRQRSRDQVLDTLETMRNWSLPELHLLATSRDEKDIRDALQPFSSQDVLMKNAGIDRDITDFISARLDKDRRLQKWRSYRDQIQSVLAERAHGMFRWVDCQLISLRSCLCSEEHLEEALQSLPETLDKTYQRMLEGISPRLVKDARRVLTLLCFATRPLTVRELIDGLAIDIGKSPRFNIRRRLHNASDLYEICPGLIEIGLSSSESTQDPQEVDLIRTVRIAHFSVQEYLESERVQPAIFGLVSAAAHAEMARLCLVYLLEPDLSRDELHPAILEQYPFAHFAATYWCHHYENTASQVIELDQLVLELFQNQKEHFFTWVRLHDMDRPWKSAVDFERSHLDIASPIYYASLLGYEWVLRKLLKVDRQSSEYAPGHYSSITSEIGVNLNAPGREYGSALQAAPAEGHEKVVQMLLDKGADVNAQGGVYGSAIHAASAEGHEKIVQMLLGKGADVNALGGDCSSALQAASAKGHEKVVQILLEKGADLNAQDGDYGSALQEASAKGHEKVVRILLDKGADMNAQDGWYGSVLQAASAGGHERVVRILLVKGADVNAQGGWYGSVLQAASAGGHEKVVYMLLEKGADVSAQCGRNGSALQAASAGGHEKVVYMLLDKGADVNAQGGRNGSALQAASAGGHEKVVYMLLDKGADVNAQGGWDGSALQAASAEGHEKVVQILLDKGADVNAQTGVYGSALQAASDKGHEKVVQMLLDKGANVNAQGGVYGSALQAALDKGHEKILQILLDAGAVLTKEDALMMRLRFRILKGGTEGEVKTENQ